MIRGLGEKKPKVAESAFVSEAAYVVGDVEIGENSSVWPGAVLRADRFRIRIGSNSNIQDNCVVHAGFSDLFIGNNVTIAHGSMIHCARIGNNVLVGIHAVLNNQSEVEDFCMIGAYSMVKDHFKVPTKSLVLGIPAKIKRPLNDRELERIANGSRTYVELAKEFKKYGL
ncbi:MAG TPA: gamma carbonic anhydrase family protein [Thermodesulfobacteriota bacterium]|jgi:carbonic anhydrase/acetyltransferase-like protein (isoleucine patch superfamily)|nr:gamma carbonic anhydrase family protein [Thermodesulfobacteriota bacterium]